MIKKSSSGKPATRKLFGQWWLLLTLAGLLNPQLSFAAPVPVKRPTNRWLLVVETSRNLKPRDEAIAQITGNLVLSGMNGQMREGDTLGVWTYNNELHAGGFPLQTWSPENSKVVAERVAKFLANNKFENRPNFSKVLPMLGVVITNSDFITVLWISGGGEKISGTPYDKAINAIHKKWQDMQDKAKMPFITALRAQGGRITDFEVNMPPKTLEMPPLPPELLVTNTPPETAIVQTPPPAPIGEPLIIHGKKPTPEPVVASNPPPVATEIKPPPLPATNPVVETKSFIPTNPPPSTATNLAVAGTEPAATNHPAAVLTNQAQATTPVQNPGGGDKRLLLIICLAAAGGAGLAFLFARRSQTKSQASLITRSLDRKNK